jgi:hypothetical protein
MSAILLSSGMVLKFLLRFILNFDLFGSMSAKIKTALSIFILFVLVGGYFYTQVDWEARAIRRQLSRLTDLVEKDGPVSTFEALGRSRKLPGFFTQDALIEYLPRRSLPPGNDAISGAFLSLWNDVETASIAIRRHEVEVFEKHVDAESRATVRASVILNGREQMGDTMKYRISWRYVEGDWRIQSVVALGQG